MIYPETPDSSSWARESHPDAKRFHPKCNTCEHRETDIFKYPCGNCCWAWGVASMSYYKEEEFDEPQEGIVFLEE